MKMFRLFCVASFLVSCGPKTPASSSVENVTPVGWIQAPGAMGECYNPPDFDAVAESGGIVGRRMARADTLDAMLSQWNGGKNDGISFSEGFISDVETILLSTPVDIEAIAPENYNRCVAAMAIGGSPTSWEQWFSTLPETLTEGECYDSLLDRLFHYVEISAPWYWEIPMCEGDELSISASMSDRFRIEDDGDWITVEGVTDGSVALEDNHPCVAAGCLPGMLVGRFQSDNGFEDYFPIGAGVVYRAPFEGTLSVGINDINFGENSWFSNGGVIDHASIEIGPAGE
tara:strand:+ start:170 stop:1030 length:861 start_codon:yes stop_codon:yes gene_type:complete